MLLDIPIGLFLVVAGLVGFRDGLVRKIVSIVVMAVALILGQVYMHDVGNFLTEQSVVSKHSAPMAGYLAVFLGATIIQSLLYKILTGGYKIGGFADRLIGAALGLLQGAFFLSSLLFILAMARIPSKDLTHDSRLYKPIINVAPQILDFVSTAGPESVEKLKELGTPKVKKEDQSKSNIDTTDSRVLDEEKQTKMLNDARTSNHNAAH